MHTAFGLEGSMFTVVVDGMPVDRDVMLDYGDRDRFGIVIDRPMGALGAGLLISIITTAYYDMPTRARRTHPAYPEIFLFHAGGPWGDFSNFDFFPEHKEICLPADPRDILPAINNRGITHLAVPDRALTTVEHRFAEVETAIDRLKQCYAYSPDGQAANGEIVISTTDMRVLSNYEATLDIEKFADENLNFDALIDFFPQTMLPVAQRSAAADQLRVTTREAIRRLPEQQKTHPDHVRAKQRIADARAAGLLEERYRSVTSSDIVGMLC